MRLSSDEYQELVQCERTINQGLATFFEVGVALTTIKSKKLYRAHFATFEAYCQTRWEISRFYAYRLVNAARIVEKLLSAGNKLPKHEAQVRPLTAIDPTLVPAVWKRATETAGDGRVTARLVRKAIGEIANGKQKPAGCDHVPCEVDSWTQTLIDWTEKLRSSLRTRDHQAASLWIEKIRLMHDTPIIGANGVGDDAAIE